MKIGVLTGGGDCPGLNAAIRAIFVRASELGYEVIGIEEGWKGLMEAKGRKLTRDEVDGAFKDGGTILFTSRTNPYKTEGGEKATLDGFKKLGLGALIPIGGEDTLGVAQKLTKAGLPCVAVPKTIDNDLDATDTTIGFDTAVSIAMDAIDRIHTTARSHHRCAVVEIMGRHAGWMTFISGLGGGAHVILIPEEDRKSTRLNSSHVKC
jgi:6-phosphofructokinase